MKLFFKSPKIGINYFSNINELVETVINRSKPVSVIAMNAEKLVNMYHNENYLGIHKSAIFYPDGNPITWFANGNYPRLPGVEVWIVLLRKAIALEKRVLIMGSTPDVIERCALVLANAKLDKNVNYLDGFRDEHEYVKLLQKLKPDFVFVALGTPKQERLISTLQTFHKEAVYMGIGGSLDILAGHKRRAPKLFRAAGLEFLYRLLSDPRRIFRQQIYLRFIFYYITKKFVE